MTDAAMAVTGAACSASAAGCSPSAACRARAAPITPTTVRPIRSCILVFYYGGPSHLDTYDLKPNAPAEVRGEFKPIATASRACGSASTCRTLARRDGQRRASSAA